MKKGVESISQRNGSGDPDPDPHQNVTDPQHCLLSFTKPRFSAFYFLLPKLRKAVVV
jgi:hypothetical protein